MTSQCAQALSKCNTFSEMLTTIRQYYNVTSEVGNITKTLIINGINSKMEKKIPDDVIGKIKKSNTVGDMIAMLSDHYKGVIVKPEHKIKIIAGLDTIIVMTRLKLKSEITWQHYPEKKQL